MNLSSQAAISAQYQIVRTLVFGGAELISSVPKLRETLHQCMPDFDGEGSGKNAFDVLMHVRQLPSYPQIRLGLMDNTDSNLLVNALTQLNAESLLCESDFTWALSVWLGSEICVMRTAIPHELTRIVAEQLSQNGSFERWTIFITQYFTKSKNPHFALPFLWELVKRNPDDAGVRLDLARTQIAALEFKAALETLAPIVESCDDEPDKVSCGGDPQLLAQKAYLKGRALTLLGWMGSSGGGFGNDPQGALEFAVREYGCDIPEYWYGLGLERLGDGYDEEGIRCLDRSLEVAHLRLLLDLRSKAAGASQDLSSLLRSPVMDAAIQRQRLRTLRSLAEWAAKNNCLDYVGHMSRNLPDMLRSQIADSDCWVVCSDGSELTPEIDVSDYQTVLRVEACRVLSLFGVGDIERSLFAELAKADSDIFVNEAARKALASE